MPLAPASPSFSAASPHWFRVTLRAIRAVLLSLLAAFCLILLAVRFIVFPHLQDNRDDLTRLLGREIGKPVQAESLDTGWDGWNPRVAVRGFRILDRADGKPILALPEVRMTLAWTSLLFLELRLKELVIDRPVLSILRDNDGMLHLAGQTIDPRNEDDEGRMLQWLLHQPNILVRDAAITWHDRVRGGDPLTLSNVTLRLENEFGHHRFGLKATPPMSLASPLDVRGDVTGMRNADWHDASGKLYARLDYADVAAWRDWLPMPIPIKSGKGALRVWFDIAHGDVREVVADVVLQDVQASLASDVAELGLTRLEGRLGWRVGTAEREFSAQHLAFTGQNGARFDPTDFKLILAGSSGDPTGGQVEFDNIELTPLRLMAASLPLPARWRDDLGTLAPRGSLKHGRLKWRGDLLAPQTFSGAAEFSELGIAAHESRAGFSGMSGDVDATEAGGTLKLRSKGARLDIHQLFTEPLLFEATQGQARWRMEKEGVVIAIDHMAFSNAEVSLVLNGELRPQAGTAGSADLSGEVTRIDARQVARYLPLAGSPSVVEWLRSSILAGTGSEGKFRLAGNLADFPFVDGRHGQFIASIKAQGVSLDYAARWPSLTDVDAELRFDGAHVVIDARRARVTGAEFSRLKAELADFRGPNAPLHVDGEVRAPIGEFFRFIAESPVDEWIGHATRGAAAAGNGSLALKLVFPLGKPQDNRIAGEFTFDNDRVKLAESIPALSQISGTLSFVGNEVRASNVSTEILGGPARVGFSALDDRVRVDVSGSANLAALKDEFPQHTLATRLSGTTDWQLGMDIAAGAVSWTLDSSLRGATVELPLPMAKAPAASVPLRVERRSIDAAHDVLSIAYGSVGRLTLHRRLAGDSAVPERGQLSLGKAQGDVDRPGLWIRGDLSAIDLDEWLDIKNEIAAGADADLLKLNGVDVSVGTLDLRGREFSDLRVAASRSGDDWQLDLQGREVAGTARWQAPGPGRPNGRVVARLQRLTTPPAAPATLTNVSAAESTAVDNPWPALDISADAFRIKDHDVGQLQLMAKPSGRDWRIESLKVSNDDGQFIADGWWRGGTRIQRTELGADLEAKDAGRYLARFGMPDAIRGAATHIRGTLAWDGSPEQFDYPTLGGTLRIESGPGQFTKINPGVGKLLGVLSLQSLRRRLAFDFKDLFGEGFAFDDIAGDIMIKDGVMKTDNLRINGSAAHVTISGETDIARETERLRVRVQPTLSAGVSVGAAALMLANPILGAAVAAGSLLAQKALQDPIEKMFSYEYVVTGGWADPVVERIGGNASATAAEAGR